MPAKNVIKPYVPDGYYHVYNRGVNKTDVFLDEQDYGVFLSYLSTALTSKDEDKLRTVMLDELRSYKDREEAKKLLRLKNFTGKIELLAYVLMPNHFHLLLKQKAVGDMTAFVQAVMTRFTMYINLRYKRVGPVFQGAYKAVFIDNEPQLLHVSRYIHRNPFNLKGSHPSRLQPSSYLNYLGVIHQEWVKSAEIISYFSSSKTGFLSYKAFVEMRDGDFEEQSMKLIEKVGIDLN